MNKLIASLAFGFFLLLIQLPVYGQDSVQVRLRDGVVHCFDQTIRLKHIADTVVERGSRKSSFKPVELLDIDSFSQDPKEILISREQVRIRLLLAGYADHQIQLSGPEQVKAVWTRRADMHGSIESILQRSLASYYRIPIDDLSVTIDQRFRQLQSSDHDFSSVQMGNDLPIELTPGKQYLPVIAHNSSGERVATKIPVTVSLIRDLVVAKQNIARGQTLTVDNIESIRRSVSDRNIRLASYEHVLGKQVQNDIQKYSLIKSSSIRAVSARTQYAIKKNDRVRIVMHRGRLKLVVKAAKALENGNPGDSITMLNPGTNRKIQATVVDSSTVEARF